SVRSLGPQLALGTLAEAIDVPSNRPSKATVAIANALTSSCLFTVPSPCKRSARKRRAYGSAKTTLFNSFFMKASLYLHDISHDGCFVTSSPSVNRTGLLFNLLSLCLVAVTSPNFKVTLTSETVCRPIPFSNGGHKFFLWPLYRSDRRSRGGAAVTCLSMTRQEMQKLLDELDHKHVETRDKKSRATNWP